MHNPRDDERSEISDLRSRVTELETRRAALIATRDHYRDYYENSPDSYASIDPATGTIVECNQTLLDANGYTREELIGASRGKILTPESIEVLTRHFEESTRAAHAADIELLSRRKDGTSYPISLHINERLDGDGGVIYSRGSARDITEQKRTEEALTLSETRFRRIAEGMRLVPYEVSVDLSEEALASGDDFFPSDWYEQYRPDYVGAQIVRMLGYPLSSWYEPGFWFGVLHPDDRESIGRIYSESLQSKGEVRAELRMRSAGGEYVSLLDLISVRFDSDGGAVLRGVLMDLTSEKRAEEAQKRLMRELDHRVKNTHAILLAFAEQSLSSATNIDDVLEAFDGRVASLARIHNAMAAGEWTSVDLHELVASALMPFVGDAPPTIAGPAVKLGLEVGRKLGMIFHEMATNAVKYGALSNEAGGVRVRWGVTGPESHRHLEVVWREEGGPPCSGPTRFGYGLGFIQRLVPYELDGSVELAFPEAGLVCELRIPLDLEHA